MPGQRVGYVRVSTADQNADRQLDDLGREDVHGPSLREGHAAPRACSSAHFVRAETRSWCTVLIGSHEISATCSTSCSR